MLANLLKSRRSAAAAAPSIPAGERVYAIGDVHGCLDELDRVLAAIEADEAARAAARTTLIFVGDLVDRGPASAQVVERVRILADARPVRCLLGNHEEVMLGALDGDPAALKLFCRIGGRETAMSYGVGADAYERADYAGLADELRRAVPASHVAFARAMEDMIEIGDYLFVHAGVRPDVALSDQQPEDLRWIRTRFLQHDRPLEKMVVHGHTIAGAVQTRPHRIGIDTGAFHTGVLTALALEGTDRWVLQS